MPAVLALASALSYAIADIAGAVASRRTSAMWVSMGIQVTGIPVLAIGFLLLPGEVSSAALWLGALAGTVGILGLVLYLRSLAVGPVGVISPVAALVGTAVPVGWGVLLSGDALNAAQAVGVVLGLVAVVLVAWSPGASKRAYGRRGPLFAAVAGVTFGLYFVVLDATPTDSGLWPLVSSRLAGIVVLVGLLVALRRAAPGRPALLPTMVAGTLDTAATLFFLLATRGGLLSLVALLVSLSPVAALILARLFLHERLTGLQGIGVLAALAAIGLITL